MDGRTRESISILSVEKMKRIITISYLVSEEFNESEDCATLEIDQEQKTFDINFCGKITTTKMTFDEWKAREKVIQECLSIVEKDLQ